MLEEDSVAFVGEEEEEEMWQLRGKRWKRRRIKQRRSIVFFFSFLILFFSSKNFEYVVEKIKKEYSSESLIYVGLFVSCVLRASIKPTGRLWREEISRFVRQVRMSIDAVDRL